MKQRVVVEPSEALSLFQDSCAWATRMSFCVARIDTREGTTRSWLALQPHLPKLEAFVLNLDGRAAEPWALRRIAERAPLRIAPGDSALMYANAFAFRRDGEARVLLGSWDLSAVVGERAVSSTLYATGDASAELFCGVRRLLDRCRGLAHLPTPAELEQYAHRFARKGSVIPPPPSVLAVPPLHDRLDLVTDAKEIEQNVWRLAGTLGTRPMTASERDDMPPLSGIATGMRASVQDEDERWLIRLEPDLREEQDGKVEIAIPKSGTSGRFAGAFARAPRSDEVYFVHRGVFRPHSRIASDLFWHQTRCRPVEIFEGDGDDGLAKVAVVCRLEAPEARAHIAAFFDEIRRLRTMADEYGEEEEEEEPYGLFLEEHEEQQLARVWEILLGAGPLDRDQAVRHAAHKLREAGEAQYGRLDSAGELYSSIDAAISEGLREGLFDRPRRGQVRAIMEPGSSEWLQCLLNALGTESVDRQDAIRAAAEYAREIYGVEFKRLRSGGKIERAVKTAINSGVRRGVVRRDGNKRIAKVEVE